MRLVYLPQTLKTHFLLTVDWTREVAWILLWTVPHAWSVGALGVQQTLSLVYTNHQIPSLPFVLSGSVECPTE